MWMMKARSLRERRPKGASDAAAANWKRVPRRLPSVQSSGNGGCGTGSGARGESGDAAYSRAAECMPPPLVVILLQLPGTAYTACRRWRWEKQPCQQCGWATFHARSSARPAAAAAARGRSLRRCGRVSLGHSPRGREGAHPSLPTSFSSRRCPCPHWRTRPASASVEKKTAARSGGCRATRPVDSAPSTGL